MHRQYLLDLLKAYTPIDKQDQTHLSRTIQFVENSQDCFKNWHPPGHITGSAWVINSPRTEVLLTHHKKLKQWFQLGGHSDADPNTLQVAIREATEESGLLDLYPPQETIFDIDIHRIPAINGEQEHWHYDIRFLLIANQPTPLHITDESNELAWIAMDQVTTKTTERSVLRMVDKMSIIHY